MSPGRNDPCPCGSGKKYKACHLRADESAARMDATQGPEPRTATAARVKETARRAAFWEVDVLPLASRRRETGEPTSLVVVMAEDVAVAGDVLQRRPIGVEARARVVVDAVMAGGRTAGLLPERLHVRDEALARALRPEMEARGITVQAMPLPALDEMAQAALEGLSVSAAGAVASMPWVWAETEATPGELAELHAAAAAFYRAAPWHQMESDEGLLLTFPGEDAPWVGCVMGAIGVHYGLALYSDPEDVRLILEEDERPQNNFVRAGTGISLSLSFDAAQGLTKAMRREVAAAGWEVAGPDAYPTLIGIHIPGRRITAELVRRLTVACRAVTAWVTLDEVPPWIDPGTGVLVEDFLELDGDEDENDEDLDLPWPPLRECHPIGPVGAKANPQAAIRANADKVADEENRRLERFDRWMNRQRLSRAARDRLERTALAWAEHLVISGIPAEAATEYDLRLFLYDYLPRVQVPPKAVARYLTRSLRELFRFLKTKEDIRYPWAEAVLADLDALTEGVDDVREMMAAVHDMYLIDMLLRVQRPNLEVGGVGGAWAQVQGREMLELRYELHRRWLIWHDEVVGQGITLPDEVREVLIGRQRQWENTRHELLGGRTPKQALLASLEKQ